MLTQTHQPKQLRKDSLKSKRSMETGFPSPATDHLEDRLNLHEHLVKNTAATFFCRVSGPEDEGLGFYDGDLLIVDRSLAFKHHSIVVALVEGELRICRLWNRGKRWSLELAGNQFVQLEHDQAGESCMWGVVSHVVHSCI